MIRILVFLALFFSFVFTLEVHEPLFPKGEKFKEFIVNEGVGHEIFFSKKEKISFLKSKIPSSRINFIDIDNQKIFFQLNSELLIEKIAIAKNNSYLVFQLFDYNESTVLKLFDIKAKKVVKSFFLNSEIKFLSISQDGKYILYLSENNKIYILSTKEKKIISIFNIDEKIKKIKISALNKYIIVQSENNISFYDFNTFQKINTFNIKDKYFTRFDISNNEKYFLLSQYYKIKIWNLSTKNLILDLNVTGVIDSKFTNDSNKIIYNENNILKILNIKSPKNISNIKNNNLEKIDNFLISNDDKKVLINKQFLLNLDTLSVRDFICCSYKKALDKSKVVWSKKSNTILSIDSGKGIKVWNLQKNKLDSIIEKDSKINDIILSKDEKYLLFSTNKELKIWDLEEEIIIKKYKEDNSTIKKISISDSGNLIAFQIDKKIEIIDFKFLKLIQKIDYISNIYQLKFFDDKYIILGDYERLKIFDIKTAKLVNEINESRVTLNTYDNSHYYQITFHTKDYKEKKRELRDILTNKNIMPNLTLNEYIYGIEDNNIYIYREDINSSYIWDLEEKKIIKNIEKNNSYNVQLDMQSIVVLDDDNEKIKEIFYNKKYWAIADYKTKKLYRYGDKDFLLDAKTFQPILPKRINVSKDDIKVFFDKKSIKLINNTPTVCNIQIKNISNHKLYWIEPIFNDENFTIETNSIIELEPNEIKSIQVSIQYNEVVEQSFSKDLTFKVTLGGEVVSKEKLNIEVEKREDIDIESIELENVILITVKLNKFIDKNLTNLKVILSEGNKSIENNPYYDYGFPPIETNESIIVHLPNNKTFFYTWGKGHDFTVTVYANEIKPYIIKRHINFDMPLGIYIILSIPSFLLLVIFYFIYMGYFNPNIKRVRNNPSKIFDVKLDKLPYYKKILKRGIDKDYYENNFSYILENDIDKVSNFFKSTNEEKANLFAKKANGKLSKIDNNFFEITLAQNFELSLESFLLYFPNTIDMNSIFKILEEKGSAKPIILIGQTEKEQKMLNESELLHRLPYILGLSLKNLKIFLLKQEHTKSLAQIFATRLDRKLISPYQEEGQLRNESYFFGREKIIHHIYSRELSNYFIVGARQIGKSSLLKRLELKFKSRDDVICFSFQDTRYLLKDIARALNIDKNSSLEEIEFYIADSSKTYLFLIDEADEFVKNEKNSGYKTLQAFRSLTQKGKAYFIMAGYYELFSQISFDYHSPIKNFGEIIRLGKLEFEACANLIVTPMDNLGLHYQNIEDAVKIITQTGQRANLIAMVCNDIVKNLNKFTNEIRKSDIDKALECSKVRNTHYEWHNNIYRNQRQSYITQIIVYASVRTEYFTLKQVVDMFDSLELKVSIEEIRESLQLLELMYIIDKNSNNVYKYTIPLMQKELQKDDEIMLERVVYEFKNSKNI